MSYRGFYRSYPLLDNRLYGTLNEYAELNDVASKNNYIYATSVADNYHKRHDNDYDRPRPSLYSLYSTPLHLSIRLSTIHIALFESIFISICNSLFESIRI